MRVVLYYSDKSPVNNRHGRTILAGELGQSQGVIHFSRQPVLSLRLPKLKLRSIARRIGARTCAWLAVHVNAEKVRSLTLSHFPRSFGGNGARCFFNIIQLSSKDLAEFLFRQSPNGVALSLFSFPTPIFPSLSFFLQLPISCFPSMQPDCFRK